VGPAAMYGGSILCDLRRSVNATRSRSGGVTRLGWTYTAAMPPSPAGHARLDAVDGLRGGAIILVVISHGWVLWPTSFITSHTWVEPLFRSGDSAVSVFLVVSGFLLFRAISSSDTRVQMLPITVAVRRLIRVGPAMWLMLVAVMVVAAIDPQDTETKQVNRDSFFHALTYTYNWLVQESLTQTRSDLGHLWYVSVDMQAVVVVAILAFFLRYRPRLLLASLVVLFVVLVAWRFHSYGVENIWVALNRTTARMDAFVVGALSGALVTALPPLPAFAAYRRYLSTTLVVLLIPILYWCVDESSYMRWGGTALEVVVAVFLLGMAIAPVGPDVVLGNRPLVALGRMSLVIYLWHFPIFHFVSRHAHWDWPWKALVAFAATAVIALLTQVLIERRVSRLLARPEWDSLRDGNYTVFAKSLRHPGKTSVDVKA
jgi:peptidoglycan/LPS O-acetylase OafA/YrhL